VEVEIAETVAPAAVVTSGRTLLRVMYDRDWSVTVRFATDIRDGPKHARAMPHWRVVWLLIQEQIRTFSMMPLSESLSYRCAD
jgi:hypothetical protein